MSYMLAISEGSQMWGAGCREYSTDSMIAQSGVAGEMTVEGESAGNNTKYRGFDRVFDLPTMGQFQALFLVLPVILFHPSFTAVPASLHPAVPDVSWAPDSAL